MQVVGTVGKARPQVVEVAPEPTAAHADFVRRVGDVRRIGVRAGTIVATQCAVHQQRREVHAGIDGQLQRAPQATVELDERVPACGTIHFALDHGDPLPVESREKRVRFCAQVGRHGDTLAIDADAAGGRLLAQPAVRERRAQTSVPTQCEDALGRPHHALLHERRKGARGQRFHGGAQGLGRRNEFDVELPPASVVDDHGVMRLEDRGECHRRQYRVQFRPVLQQHGHRHVEAGGARDLQHARLVATAAECVRRWQRHRDRRRDEVWVREHGGRRRVGHGQQHVDAMPNCGDADFRGVRGRREQGR